MQRPPAYNPQQPMPGGYPQHQAHQAPGAPAYGYPQQQPQPPQPYAPYPSSAGAYGYPAPQQHQQQPPQPMDYYGQQHQHPQAPPPPAAGLPPQFSPYAYGAGAPPQTGTAEVRSGPPPPRPRYGEQPLPQGGYPPQPSAYGQPPPQGMMMYPQQHQQQPPMGMYHHHAPPPPAAAGYYPPQPHMPMAGPPPPLPGGPAYRGSAGEYPYRDGGDRERRRDHPYSRGDRGGRGRRRSRSRSPPPPARKGGAAPATAAITQKESPPCRTLFIRNLDYRAKEEDIKKRFEEYGEIRSVFNLLERRGLIFVTFFDIRAAEKARKELQGVEMNGRRMDVHFSLPKEEDLRSSTCDRDKNQGTILLTLRESKEPLKTDELYRLFQTFGEVKIVRDFRGHPKQRFIEFFDSRSCAKAVDELDGKSYFGGTLNLVFVWDTPTKIRANYDERLPRMEEERRPRSDYSPPPPPPPPRQRTPPPAEATTATNSTAAEQMAELLQILQQSNTTTTVPSDPRANVVAEKPKSTVESQNGAGAVQRLASLLMQKTTTGKPAENP